MTKAKIHFLLLFLLVAFGQLSAQKGLGLLFGRAKSYVFGRSYPGGVTLTHGFYKEYVYENNLVFRWEVLYTERAVEFGNILIADKRGNNEKAYYLNINVGYLEIPLLAEYKWLPPVKPPLEITPYGGLSLGIPIEVDAMKSLYSNGTIDSYKTYTICEDKCGANISLGLNLGITFTMFEHYQFGLRYFWSFTEIGGIESIHIDEHFHSEVLVFSYRF